ERAAPLADRGRGHAIDLPCRKIAAVAVPAHVRHQIDGKPAPAELLCQRQRREEMAAGSAGREHHRGRIHCVAGPNLPRLLSFLSADCGVLKRRASGRRRVSARMMPMVRKVEMSEEPPAEMNGSVMPSAGNRPTLTAMLIAACSPNSNDSPPTASRVNGSVSVKVRK